MGDEKMGKEQREQGPAKEEEVKGQGGEVVKSGGGEGARDLLCSNFTATSLLTPQNTASIGLGVSPD